jgi:hypothetical protein
MLGYLAGTIRNLLSAVRMKEVDQLQICDVLWRFNPAFHVMYANNLACRIYKRKQDTARRSSFSAPQQALRSYVNVIG